MERLNCTTEPRSPRLSGPARLCMTIIVLLSSACAHGKQSEDTPLFMGCRLLCEREGVDVDSVLETETRIDCSCKKPDPFLT